MSKPLIEITWFGENLTKSLRLDDFLESEDINAKETSNQYKEDLKAYETSFNLLLEIFDYLCRYTKHKRPSTAKVAVLSILPRIVQSMQSIRTLNLKGYHYDTKILERSLAESIGLCAYLSLNEEEAKAWIKRKDVKIAKRRLIEYIPKLLQIGEDSEATHMYGTLSGFVHSHMNAINSFIDNIDSRASKISLKIIPEFNKKDIVILHSYPILMAAILGEIFRDELPKKNREKIFSLMQQIIRKDK